MLSSPEYTALCDTQSRVVLKIGIGDQESGIGAEVFVVLPMNGCVENGCRGSVRNLVDEFVTIDEKC
ncbi:MAG: hypothetical protein C4323_14025 [Mastigocladus sp. ERB_26_2]